MSKHYIKWTPVQDQKNNPKKEQNVKTFWHKVACKLYNTMSCDIKDEETRDSEAVYLGEMSEIQQESEYLVAEEED